MKKKYVVIAVALAVSTLAMSFRPTVNKATNTQVLHLSKQEANVEQTAQTNGLKSFTPLAVAALAVDCKVVVITAVGYAAKKVTQRLEPEQQELIKVQKNISEYKTSLQEIETRNLDRVK